MSYCEYNANPEGKRVGDCTIRAISAALHMDWQSAYCGLVCEGYKLHDMPPPKIIPKLWQLWMNL